MTSLIQSAWPGSFTGSDRRHDLAAVGCLVESFAEGHAVTDGWRRYEGWLNNRRTTEQIALSLLVESPLCPSHR